MNFARSAGGALALLLAACAGGSGQWTKPGAAGETVSADLDDCRNEAREATRRDDNIDADILASRGNDWQRGGMLGVQRNAMASEKSGHSDSLIDACMSLKGYQQSE